jgi:hypothetical protein
VVLLEFVLQAGDQGRPAVFMGHSQCLNHRLKAPLTQICAQLCCQTVGLIDGCTGDLNATLLCLKAKPSGRTIHTIHFALEFSRLFLGNTPNFHKANSAF